MQCLHSFFFENHQRDSKWTPPNRYDIRHLLSFYGLLHIIQEEKRCGRSEKLEVDLYISYTLATINHGYENFSYGYYLLGVIFYNGSWAR